MMDMLFVAKTTQRATEKTIKDSKEFWCAASALAPNPDNLACWALG